MRIKIATQTANARNTAIGLARARTTFSDHVEWPPKLGDGVEATVSDDLVDPIASLVCRADVSRTSMLESVSKYAIAAIGFAFGALVLVARGDKVASGESWLGDVLFLGRLTMAFLCTSGPR